MKYEIDVPEMLDYCEDFKENPKMNCENYNLLQCVGCDNCKPEFKDNGVGTTFKCRLQHPLAWIHIWQPSRLYSAVKIKSIVYKSSYE